MIKIGKATSHNYNYMINMGGQRLKIGGNWLVLICSTVDISEG